MSVIDALDRIASLPCPLCGNGIRFWQKWVQVRDDGIRMHEKCAKREGKICLSPHRGLGKIVEDLLKKGFG